MWEGIFEGVGKEFINEHVSVMSNDDFSRWGTIGEYYKERQIVRMADGAFRQTFAEWLLNELYDNKFRRRE